MFMRERRRVRRPSQHIFASVVLSPLGAVRVFTTQEFTKIVCRAHSANAVYICLCSATAVGAVLRKRSFRRGFCMSFHVIMLSRR